MTAGTRLGPYEILDLIGAGGMGEVYRARDTRLDRIVALKVSRDQFSERFEREARSVAALNHPNIAALYDVGPNYLVMEFVEGENLAGPLPLDTAVNYARQIAEAIEAAHEKGIVHRDLKPANVKVTPAGAIKVLDFGLAKALSEDPLSGSMQDSPTLSMAMTRAGMILGTAAYMSPEQAKGKPADRRADIWAFGVVFYEMLAGGQTFSGDTAAETLASVLKETITFDRLPVETPATLRTLLARCLERDVRKRLQAIGEARIILEGPLEAPVEPVAALPAPPPSRSGNLGWIASGVLALALVGLAAWTWWPRPQPVEFGMARFTVAPPEGAALTSNSPNAPQLAVSPDGRQVAFIADEMGRSRDLWVRPLGSLTAQKLDRTEGARFPFWSPDSQSIGFFADGKLKRIPVSGGSPLTICDAPNGEGGTWNREGVIVFAPDSAGPLHRVLAAGGVSAPVTTVDKAQESAHVWPQFLPDGKRVIYLARGGNKPGIYVQSLGAKERTFLLATAGRAAFASPGFLLFLRDNTLLAQRLDPGNLKFSGEPVSIAEDVRIGGNNGRNSFSVSENGVLAYRAGGGGGNAQISWYGRDGKLTGVALPAGDYGQIELSPDDKRLVVERVPGGVSGTSGVDLWLLDIASGVFSRLTSGTDSERDPVWSPDSRRVAFTLDGKETGIREIVVGSGEAPVFSDGKIAYLDDWSRDGKLIVYHPQGGKTISVLPLSDERKPKVVFDTPFQTDEVRLSPDGRWVAYMSLESGQPEVYLAAFPSFTDRRQISKGIGLMPRWRKDGRELFYVSSTRQIIAVEIKAGATIETSPAKILFQTSTALSATNYSYAVTGDGQKFLVREPANTSNAGSTEPLHVVINWPAALAR
jgi:serine/threonine protein kinase/Tol biopolymer transport system component